MSKLREEVRVLISSASDVQQERRAVEEVINEVNLGHSKMGVRLECVRWETHVNPDVGSDTQMVINNQLADDYDVYIGIFWHRFGTPTPRFDSGSLEEFEAAIEKHEKDPRRNPVMLYFKKERVALEDVDPVQLAQLNEFKKGVAKTALYSEFGNTEEFSRLARIHLTRLIVDFGQRGTMQFNNIDRSVPAEKSGNLSNGESDEEAEGIFDWNEKVLLNTDLMTEIGKQWAEDLRNLTITLNNQTSRANAAAGLPLREKIREAKRLADFIAQQINAFADRFESQVSSFQTASRIVFETIPKSVSTSVDLGAAQPEGVLNLSRGLEEFRRVMASSADSLVGLKQIVQKMPGFTGKFIHAKRRLGEALTVVESELRSAINLAAETTRFLNGLAAAAG